MAVAIVQTANPAGVAAVAAVATYSSISIGTATSDRIIVVCVGKELAGGGTPSACTIDYGSGDTAMTRQSPAGGLNSMFAVLFYLAVPTGTTATIKVTFTASSPLGTENHIAVYAVTGASTTLSAQGKDTSSDMDVTDPLTVASLTVPTDGGVIACAACATDTVAKTWANIDEDIDADAGTFRFTTAFRATGQTATITCTGTTNGEDGSLGYMVFQPAASTSIKTKNGLAKASIKTAQGLAIASVKTMNGLA